MTEIQGIIFDVDGTLIDSNDANAYAWVQAMKENGHEVPFERVRPLIGMGGDKVLPEVLGIEKDSEEGKKISQRRKEVLRTRYMPTLKAFPETKALLQCIQDHGLKMAIATSADPDEMERLLKIIDPHAEDFFEQKTSSKDAQKSKPSPDIMEAAISRIDLAPNELVMLGDTPYDIEAAEKAGIKTIALRCGGWQDKDLKDAIAIYDDPADFLAHYDSSPLSSKQPAQ